jgi:AraC-like DNA-binding protein
MEKLITREPPIFAEALPLMLRRAQLAALVERHASGDGVHATAIAGLRLLRSTRHSEPIHTLYEPALCLLAQGRKQVLLGDRVTEYDPLNHLVVSQDLPVAGQVIGATPDAPYLCVWLKLDQNELAALMLDIGRPPEPANPPAARGLYTEPTEAPLLDAALRLVRLLDTPRDIAALAPLVRREILYRLLASPNGWRLASTATPDSHDQRISRAIAWLRPRLYEPLRIGEMAQAVHMSQSSLHQHFKAVTAMSPLQYQKRLRLQEARRLLLGEGIDAATAGHRVGYQSPSQFSREYARLFGAPPGRDSERLRQAPAQRDRSDA